MDREMEQTKEQYSKEALAVVVVVVVVVSDEHRHSVLFSPPYY